MNELCKSNDNLFFPTDDDDWFHEDIIEITIDKLEQNVARWKYMHLINAELAPKKWGIPNYQTNNFCVKSPCNISNFDQGDLNYQNKKSQFIDENLSIHNKTIASISYWSNNKEITQNNLIQGVENIKKMKIDNDVPNTFHKYIDMLYDLVLKIKLKALF